MKPKQKLSRKALLKKFEVGDIITASNGHDGIGIVECVHDGGEGQSVDLVCRDFNDDGGMYHNTCIHMAEDCEVCINNEAIVAIINRGKKARA